jgi:hypothetical protein
VTLVEEVMTFIEDHKAQLDSIYMSRNEQHSMNLLLQKLESAKITCMGDVGTLMEDVVLLSKHIFIKNTIRTDFNEARRSVTSKTLVTNSDWKENVKRGRGPKEDSTVVHTIEPTAVFGTAMQYYNEELRKPGRIYVTVLSDILDKSQLAAIRLEQFIFRELLKLDWFQKVYAKVETVHQYYDQGKHFFANDFLCWKLVQLPKKIKKTVVVQYFEGGHGKTGWIDGAMFGSPGVGGVVGDIAKKTRLLTTTQLMKACEVAKRKVQAEQTEEKRKLDHWIYLEWKPNKKDIPKRLMTLKQKSLQSYRCWSSKVRSGYLGIAPVSIRCHGLTRDDDGVAWSSGQHYELEKHETGVKDWKRAEKKVVIAPPTDTRRLLKRVVNLVKTAGVTSHVNQPPAKHMLLASKNPIQKRKRKEGEDCKIKLTLSKAQLKSARMLTQPR